MIENATSRKRQKEPSTGFFKPERKYIRRQAALIGGLGAVAIVGTGTLAKTIDSLTRPTLADRLAQPYEKVQADVAHGRFAAGEVTRVIFSGTRSASQDTMRLVGHNGDENKIVEVLKDIHAQEGDRPLAGDPAYVPTADLRGKK